MLDISPEKLMVLLTVGLVVLGPNKLPVAARGLAQGLARARRMATNLTEPITTSLAEPRRAMDHAVSEFRSSVANHPLPDPVRAPAAPADPTLN